MMLTKTKPTLSPELKKALKTNYFKLLLTHVRCLTEEFALGVALVLCLAAITVVIIPAVGKLLSHPQVTVVTHSTKEPS